MASNTSYTRLPLREQPQIMRKTVGSSIPLGYVSSPGSPPPPSPPLQAGSATLLNPEGVRLNTSNSANRDARTGSKQTPGKVEKTGLSHTHFILIISFTIAVAAAIALLAFFLTLNKRETSRSISQSATSIITFALVQIFAVSLGIAITTGMTQVLWWYLRRKPFRLSTVDNMFTLSTQYLSFLDRDAWKHAPLMVLYAVSFLCIPIVSVFPPGALIVDFAETPKTVQHSVPIYDPEWHGANDSAYLGDHTTIFWNPGIPYPYSGLVDISGVGTWGSVTGPTITYEQSIAMGSILQSPSVCGSNCSYEVIIPAPAFVCEEASHIDLTRLLYHYDSSSNPLTYSEFEKLDFVYLAGQQILQQEIDGKSMLVVRFDIRWSSDFSQPVNDLHNISCLLYQNNTKVAIEYISGVQTTRFISSDGDVFDAGILANSTGLYNSIYNDQGGDVGSPSWRTEFGILNILGLHETMITALTGYQQMINDLLDSVVGDNFPTTMYNGGNSMFVSSDLLNSLLFNFTISYLTSANAGTMVEVTLKPWNTIYSFKDKINLYVPYGLALGVATILLSISFWVLRENGVAAQSSFLQVMCTTANTTGKLHDLAATHARGGEFGNELRNARVMYGELAERTLQGTPKIGIGLEEDMFSFKRRQPAAIRSSPAPRVPTLNNMGEFQISFSGPR